MFLVRLRRMVRLKNYLKFFRLKQTEYGKYFYICDVVMYGHMLKQPDICLSGPPDTYND